MDVRSTLAADQPVVPEYGASANYSAARDQVTCRYIITSRMVISATAAKP